MKSTLVTFISLLIYSLALAQDIGHTTINFKDANRSGGYSIAGANYTESGNGRAIGCEIYYPANTTGDNVAAAAGTFPVLIFGHGFVMSWDAYQNIWQFLVSQGYIIVFPRTEGSFSPNHIEFGNDLKLLVSKMQAESNRSASLLFQKLSGAFALMGHSMGGGASMLAGAGNNDIATIVNFAAAKTNPAGSSIIAAGQIQVPVLIMSGENDGVAPPAQHQDSMYASVNTVKTHIYIKGGGHCYFANSSTYCDIGENSSNPQPVISRAEQQDVNQDLIILWLNYYLKNDTSALQMFKDSLCNSSRITYLTTLPGFTCLATGLKQTTKEDLILYPNPSKSRLTIRYTGSGNAALVIYNNLGNILYKTTFTQEENIDISTFPDGLYYLKIISENKCSVRQFIKTVD